MVEQAGIDPVCASEISRAEADAGRRIGVFSRECLQRRCLGTMVDALQGLYKGSKSVSPIKPASAQPRAKGRTVGAESQW